MVQAPDKIALSGFARDGRVQRGIQDHLSLLKRRQVIKVAQELKEPDIVRPENPNRLKWLIFDPLMIPLEPWMVP